MTRVPRMTNGGGVRRIAGLHRQAGQWRLVVVEARNGSVSVLEARTLREGEIASALAGMAKEHKPERLVHVVPGSLSVCRGVEVPEGDVASVSAALSLMAEAQLPENLPGHRRAAGVVPGRASEGNRVALLTGCRDGVQKMSSPAPEFWVTEIAALAVLRGAGGTAVYADRSDGSIAMMMDGPRRTVARILVENSETSAAWNASVRGALSETCAAAGAERAPVISISDVTLELPAEALAAVRQRASGMRDEGRWLAEYGMALGGVMVAVDHDPLTAGLAAMTPDGRIVREPLMERTAAWLGRPRNAWATVAAALGLLLLGPLAIAGARLAILESKSGALAAGREERLELDRRTALYAQLEQVRWPMTKLMADVAGATPVGVVVNDFRMGNEMGLFVNGSAENLDQLYTFQRNLANSRIFREVKVNRSEFAGERVEFDLAADVASPHTVVKPAEDFSAKTLAQRLYGEGASNTATPVSFKRATAGESRPAPSRTVSNGERGGGEPRTETPRETRNGGEEASRRPTTSAPDAAPAPITDEQIAALDFGKTNLEWAKRKGAATKPGLDEATKNRLLEEVRKLEAHRDKVKGGGS